MPTPTVSRSRSPAAFLGAPNSAFSSQSTTAPIPIPGANSEISSKFPAQHARIPGTSGNASTFDRISDSDVESSLDNDSSSTHMSISSDSCASATSSPQSDEFLASTPPPRKSSVVLPPQHQQPTPASNLPASLVPRPWEVARGRVRPTITSSFLRPFSRFVGTQKSDKATYKVEVELKYVDMAQSTMSGFLRIEGLTETLPSITTYFDGEIIGTKYGFQTRHPSWGATEKTDMAHWKRFDEFEPLYAAAKRDRYHDPEFTQKDNIFMRWKEQFLVPDHRRTDLPGASFEGFYYIVFNQKTGGITGIYFHSKSEKYQKLKLEPVERKSGPMSAPAAVEFR